MAVQSDKYGGGLIFQKLLNKMLEQIVWSMHVLQISIGGVIGNAFLAPKFADGYGRRITMIWFSWASIPVLGLSIAAQFVSSAELVRFCCILLFYYYYLFFYLFYFIVLSLLSAGYSLA